jgi:hypothetical protein
MRALFRERYLSVRALHDRRVGGILLIEIKRSMDSQTKVGNENPEEEKAKEGNGEKQR